MYEIITYVTSNGKDIIAELIEKLGKKSATSKDAKINVTKIIQYIDYLRNYGKELAKINKNIVKHLEGDIWEIRPIGNRILFAYIYDNKIILLHHFIKKTQKTPKREIEQAKRNLQDWISRNHR